MNRKLPVIALGVGLLLIMRPNCRHGCKTVAAHLIEYGVEGFLG